MGCTNCGNGNGLPKGCKNNGSCGSGGCDKLNVFNWLSNMELPGGQTPFDIVEVRFKNTRKGFYRNTDGLSLAKGDVIAVEAASGHDVGVVSLTGELVRFQMKSKNISENSDNIRKIYRKAKKSDLDKWEKAREREHPTMLKTRKIASDLELKMKISDVEYQADNTKATFFYTADERVDFRELIKLLADEFKVRIEMKQIGIRQEAGRVGGIGSCGRELCCSTWLTDFRSVSTTAARYQQLALNPAKLAGQCGKLKCCLNFELDSYLDAIKEFPNSEIALKTNKGRALHQKTDIFKGMMWYVYEEDRFGEMIPLTIDRVKEVMEMNKMGNKPEDLKALAVITEEKLPDYENVVGQDSLTRFDNQNKKKRKKKKRKKKNRQGNQKQQS